MADLKPVGRIEDVERFQVGDLVRIHLELREQVFLDAPHGEQGIVIRLDHEDNEYHYNLPVVSFGDPSGELRMCNPDYLLIIQRQDGSEPEPERVAEADRKTEEKYKQVQASAQTKE
jgi:hypothetical protein